MPNTWKNDVKFASGSTGTGSFSIGAAVDGFRTPAQAGYTNGQTVSYTARVGTAFESGLGTYSTSGPALARTTVRQSSNGDAAVDFATAPVVMLAPLAEDFDDINSAIALKAPIASPTFTGTPAAPTASPGTNTTQVATTAFATAADDVAVARFKGYLYGLTLSNNASDATNDIDVAAGQAVDSTGASLMVLAAALTKQLDAAWSVGSAAGGLDQGSIANATYHVHLIKRVDTGVVDVIFSLSHDRAITCTMTIASPGVVTAGSTGAGHGLVAGSPFKFSTTGALPTGVTAGTQYYVIATGLTETAFQFSTSNGGSAVNTSGSQSGVHTLIAGPQLPSNYTLFRRVGSIVRVSAAIKGFRQAGDWFFWKTPVKDVTTNNIGAGANTRTLTLPVGIRVVARVSAFIEDSAAYRAMALSALDEDDWTPVAEQMGSVYGGAGSTFSDAGAIWEGRTNAAAQIRQNMSGTGGSSTQTLTTLGYIDTRGRDE